jgi:hypothetical protein
MYKIVAHCILNMDKNGYQFGITGHEMVVIIKQTYEDGYTGGSKDCRLTYGPLIKC